MKCIFYSEFSDADVAISHDMSNDYNCTMYTHNTMQIVTGIEVSSEAYFLSCGNTPQVLKDDDSHYLFCYTSDRNGDAINLIIRVILH